VSRIYDWFRKMRRPHKVQRYTALLLCLILLMVVAPVVPADWSGNTLELAFDLILIAGVYPAIWYSSHRWPFTVLTTVTLVTRWSDQLLPNVAIDFAATLLTVVWMFYISVEIISTLFRQRNVTFDVVIGAVVAYFLASVGFAQVFWLVELVVPGSFSGIEQGKETISLIYFSLGSISGVSFDSVAPVSELARSLSVLEAVFGTFYVAVTVARLVGLNIVNEQQKGDGKDGQAKL
jgi:hypothetical protein